MQANVIMYKYAAVYFSLENPAEDKHVNRVRNKLGVEIKKESSDYSTSNKRCRIDFEHGSPSLKASDFRLPSDWKVFRS